MIQGSQQVLTPELLTYIKQLKDGIIFTNDQIARENMRARELIFNTAMFFGINITRNKIDELMQNNGVIQKGDVSYNFNSQIDFYIEKAISSNYTTIQNNSIVQKKSTGSQKISEVPSPKKKKKSQTEKQKQSKSQINSQQMIHHEENGTNLAFSIKNIQNGSYQKMQ